jgi:hypothetical protein
VGILLASEQVVADVAGVLFLGELSLDGGLRHLQGVLPMVALARDRGLRTAWRAARSRSRWSTWPTSRGRSTPSGRWRRRRPAGTTCSGYGHNARLTFRFTS